MAYSYDINLAKTRYVHLLDYEIVVSFLKNKKNSTAITCIGKFYYFFAPEIPRDIVFIPSILERVQRCRVSWIRSICFKLSLCIWIHHKLYHNKGPLAKLVVSVCTNLIDFYCVAKHHLLPQKTESENVLDYRFHAVHSGFQVLDSSLCQWNLDSSIQSLVEFRTSCAVFRIPEPSIPDSTGKHFPDCGIRIPLQVATFAPFGYLWFFIMLVFFPLPIKFLFRI